MTIFPRALPPAALTFLLLGVVSSGEAQLYQVLPRKGPRLRTTQERPPAPSGLVTRPAAPARSTEVTVEIFTGPEGVGYQAQRWQQTFDRAGVFVRIRPGTSGDKVSIAEKNYGKLRQVTVIGKIERSGTLVFPQRSFSTSDSVALVEWLNELKTYGARGNPGGQPLWGLDKQKFDEIFRTLAARVEREVADLPFDDAVRNLNLPAHYPFRLSSSAQKLLESDDLRERRTRLQLKGFTRGTALAMLLSQYGLGFRPTRTPGGTIELTCVAVEAGEQTWPIGWEPPEGTATAKIAPRLYEDTVVELKDQKLVDVLEAIAEKTATPIRIDFAQLDARRVDLDSILVSVPNRHIAWALLLSKITNPSFLTPKVRRDESERPFVWITVLPQGTRKEQP